MATTEEPAELSVITPAVEGEPEEIASAIDEVIPSDELSAESKTEDTEKPGDETSSETDLASAENLDTVTEDDSAEEGQPAEAPADEPAQADRFQDCDLCPEMAVLPGGVFLIGLAQR